MEDNMNAALAISDILMDAINKKYDSVRDLNSIKVNISEEGFDDMNPVIDSIIEEENNHIGKLQQLVDLLSGGEEEIAEGKEETIEMIDNSDEFMESMTTMKKKLILSENFDNVIDDVQAVADPVFVGANEEHDENKKKYEDAIKENEKEAKETIPKEGDTGKKVTSPELKKMKLSEKLFEGLNPDFAQSCADDVSEYIMTEFVDLSNSEIREVLKYVVKHFSGPDLEESLDLDTYSEFNSAIYNAVADIIYEYQDQGITKSDIETALEWFELHFFDDNDIEENPKINHMTGVHENLEESLPVKIAKEQLSILNEGKMPSDFNVDTYLEALTEKKHITK